MGIEIINADAVAWARNYDGPLFHAFLADTPYHLTTITKRFGSKKAAPAKHGKDGAFARVSKGFMGKTWDGGNVAFRPETWEAFAKVLYPGAFGMAMGGSRTWHRLAVAIEDAGFIIHPSIFGWAYGSGFPKATRVDTQIDSRAPRKDMFRTFAGHFAEQRKVKGFTQKEIAVHFPSKTGGVTGCVWNWENAANVPTLAQWKILQPMLDLSMDYLPLIERIEAEREVIGQKDSGLHRGSGTTVAFGVGNDRELIDVTAPATSLAKAFAGYRYGLQALKPALEPIIVFQKPYEGRPVENITQYGAGVLNIDGGRIATDEIWERQSTQREGYTYQSVDLRMKDVDKAGNPAGRWPSNFILLNDGAAEALDRQSGHLESGQPMGVKHAENNIYGRYGTGIEITGYGDAGGASRFFFRVQDEIDAADPVYYCAKASTDERNAGLDDITPKELGHNRFDKCATCGGYMFQNPDRPSACKCENPVRQNNAQVNPHPTVKPIALARYLATLLLPPTEYQPRRLFIPFAGVGSECIGAYQAGWDEITGVELTAEYIPIAEARIKYWMARGFQLSMFDNSLMQNSIDV